MYRLQRANGQLFACGPTGEEEIQRFDDFEVAQSWATLLADDGEGPLTVVKFKFGSWMPA